MSSFAKRPVPGAGEPWSLHGVPRDLRSDPFERLTWGMSDCPSRSGSPLILPGRAGVEEIQHLGSCSGAGSSGDLGSLALLDTLPADPTGVEAG
jgi:hypothetical protein